MSSETVHPTMPTSVETTHPTLLGADGGDEEADVPMTRSVDPTYTIDQGQEYLRSV